MIKIILPATFLAGAAIACSPAGQPADRPCDGEATAATVELYATMKAATAHGVLFGHQDDLSYGVGWVDSGSGRSDVRDVTGDYPALFGWDLGHIELADSTRNIDGVDFEGMRRNMIFVAEAGGVNALSWHTRNPLTGGDAWDTACDEVVGSVSEGGAACDAYRVWLDRTADYLLSLRTADGECIPVIFRPYHEMTGGWFWWGAGHCSDQQYIALWRQTIDYLRSRGVHNILTAYSAADFDDEESFARRYPGDDYVDIVGFDIYQYGSSEEFLEQMKIKSGVARAFADSHGKIWAVCECGYESIPQRDWFTEVLLRHVCGTDCSHLLLWRNAHDREGHFYAGYPGHDSAEDMRAFCLRDQVMMLGDYVKFKQTLKR